MSFEVKTTPHFEREAKILAKRYKSFKADMKDFIESLEKNPMQGDELSPGIRKIRLAIVSKGKGKSGGARTLDRSPCSVVEMAGKKKKKCVAMQCVSAVCIPMRHVYI